MNKNLIYYFIAVAGTIVTAAYILSNPNLQSHSVVIDARLQPYVDQWKGDMMAQGFDPEPAISSLEAVAVTDMEDKLGNTQHYKHRIEVANLALEQGDAVIRATVYHELGHYVFGLDHGSCELMAEKSWPKEYYDIRWQQMKEEYINLIRSREFETHYGR